MPPAIAFIRHAPTSWSGVRYCGRSDPPLTDAGAAAAARVASDVLAAVRSVAPARPPRQVRLVTSPLGRAVATARAIQTVLGCPLVVDPRWTEADMGIVEGWTWDELQRREPALATRLLAAETEIDWPGGETAASLRTRVTAGLDDLRGEDGPVVVVSHAGPIRLALATIRGVPPGAVALPGPASVTWVEPPVGGTVAHAGTRPA